MMRPGFRGDPFKDYGVRLSHYIFATIGEVPEEGRTFALEALLDELEPGLFSRVTERANRYRDAGLRSTEAVRAAIASSTSQTLAEQIRDVALGRQPAVQSLAGLGFYPESEAITLAGYRHALGICGPRCLARKAKAAAKKAGGAVKRAGKKVGRTAKKAGKKVADAAYRWGKRVVAAAKSLHCKIAESKVGTTAAGAIAAYYGVPPKAGIAAHKTVNAKVCGQAADAPAATATFAATKLAAPKSHSKSSLRTPLLIGGALALGLVVVKVSR